MQRRDGGAFVLMLQGPLKRALFGIRARSGIRLGKGVEGCCFSKIVIAAHRYILYTFLLVYTGKKVYSYTSVY